MAGSLVVVAVVGFVEVLTELIMLERLGVVEMDTLVAFVRALPFRVGRNVCSQNALTVPNHVSVRGLVL